MKRPSTISILPSKVTYNHKGAINHLNITTRLWLDMDGHDLELSGRSRDPQSPSHHRLWSPSDARPTSPDTPRRPPHGSLRGSAVSPWFLGGVGLPVNLSLPVVQGLPMVYHGLSNENNENLEHVPINDNEWT